MQLLLIECDAEAAGWLAPRLSASGCRMTVRKSVESVLHEGVPSNADVILIETGSTTATGNQLVSQMRSGGIATPIIVLSSRSDWRETVATIDAGADDFIVKPVRSEEILARLRAAIRRSQGAATDRVQIGPFDLDLGARCAWLDGRCLDLTRNEFRLLRMLLLNPGKVISHQEIRAEISTGKGEVTLNAIEVQIARLRKKIGPDPIRTVRGMGYRYVGTTDAAARSNANPEPCLRNCECDTQVDDAQDTATSPADPCPDRNDLLRCKLV